MTTINGEIMSSELIGETACNVVARLRKGDVSPCDLIDALKARIARVEGVINALPALRLERARRRADAPTRRPLDEPGILAGLPVPIEDLTNVAGVGSTQASPIFANFVPDRSQLLEDMLDLGTARVVEPRLLQAA